MTKSISNFLAAVLIGGAVLATPALSLANPGDCGQPKSGGANIVTSDAQTILKAAVGQPTECDGNTCICDVNSAGGITTTDALLDLKKAVGQPVTLTCTCTPGLACTSAKITTRPGSDLDSGWTGLAHNSDLVTGASITVRILRRCSVSQTPCEHDSGCPVGETCKATCDCNTDKSCEATGPTGAKKCVNNLTDCTGNICHGGTNANGVCSSNTDCAGGGNCYGKECSTGTLCLGEFGPPLPLVTDGTPVCVVTFFDTPLTGTADSGTGEAVVSAKLRSRVFTGTIPTPGEVGGPCPRCGLPEDSPQVGDSFQCDGGQFPLAPCTVQGVSDVYGGLSTDCPPELTNNISGSGLTVRFDNVTTYTSTKTAQLPCKAFGFTNNPLVPGSNPKCIDKVGAADPVCASNADCKRCSGDNKTACASNTDCTGKGTCATAPDQPVTCGYWCNCGFCEGNASLPCFETADCPQGQTCKVGTGSNTQANAPQLQPNDCSSDKFVCGQNQEERCATTLAGKCSDKPYLPACSSDDECSNQGGGVCNIEGRSCFEPRISRTGVPSPLGTYCAFEDKTCTTNADCSGGGDNICVPDSSRAQTVALFCVPATASSPVNNAGGITGPGAVRLNSFLEVCRCGDGKIGCDEQCDDGNTANGDGCDDLCQTE